MREVAEIAEFSTLNAVLGTGNTAAFLIAVSTSAGSAVLENQPRAVASTPASWGVMT